MFSLHCTITYRDIGWVVGVRGGFIRHAWMEWENETGRGSEYRTRHHIRDVLEKNTWDICVLDSVLSFACLGHVEGCIF
jgi:hypothetical protein